MTRIARSSILAPALSLALIPLLVGAAKPVSDSLSTGGVTIVTNVDGSTARLAVGPAGARADVERLLARIDDVIAANGVDSSDASVMAELDDLNARLALARRGLLASPDTDSKAQSLSDGAAINSPNPTTSQRLSLCGGAYFAELRTTFSTNATTTSVSTSSHVAPNGFISPPNPGSFSIYSSAGARPNGKVAWTYNTNQTNGATYLPSSPTTAGTSIFKSATCDIEGTAIVSLQCAAGNWEYKSLQRNWPACGL